MPRSIKYALELFVRRLTLRSTLGAEERAALLEMEGRTVRAHGDFVHIGDRLTEACLIVDGLVARFAQISNGDRSIVALHIPGDMADLHSVVAPNVTWALHALTPTTVLRIPHDLLRRLCDRYPAIGMALWRDCVVDANVLAQWMVNVARRDAVSRVGHLLCEMELRYGAIGLEKGGIFEFPIKQLDLADAVGLTPVHLNRVLKKLRDEGLAKKEMGKVSIVDRPRLAMSAEFDPAYLQLEQDCRAKSHEHDN